MKFDLKKPCKNCPFVDGPNRITFACHDRAIEIEEIAYRQGFVCHLHSECVEDEEESYFDFSADGNSQHCWGALAMYMQSGSSNVPFEQACDEDENLEERWWDRADMDALDTVFTDETAFIEANG